MTINDLMPIPRPLMLVLQILIDQRKIDPYGGLGWGAAIPPEFRKPGGTFTIEPELLFRPMIERCMIEDCQKVHDHPSGQYFARITDIGATCLGFGYMPKAMAPTSAEALAVMLNAPASPTLPDEEEDE